MGKYILETCVDSVESALAADRAGATRIELCSNLVIGGTSPSKCLFEAIRKVSSIPIHTLLRPRFGDFCYSSYEFDILLEEVKMFRALGADGVVIGVLTPDGELDCKRMEKLMEAAKGMHVTLHRAFDMCKDPYLCLEQAKELGVNTILTSGQQNNCADGAALLKELVEKSEGKIDILIGSGVNAKIIPEMYERTGATSFHMSGKEVIESRMIYRNDKVSMGAADLDEYGIWQTKEENIRAAAEVLKKLTEG